MLEYESENLNSDEIYSSLRGVTEAIQNFSFRSQEELAEPLRRDSKRDVLQSGVGASLDSDMMAGGRTALDNKTSLLNTPSPRSFAGPRFRDYNPYNYSDGTLEKAALKEALYEDTAEQLRDGRIPDTPFGFVRIQIKLQILIQWFFFFLFEVVAKKVLKIRS